MINFHFCCSFLALQLCEQLSKRLCAFHQPLNTLHNHFLTSTSLNKSRLLISRQANGCASEFWGLFLECPNHFNKSSFMWELRILPALNPTHPHQTENPPAIPPTEITELWWGEQNQLLPKVKTCLRKNKSQCNRQLCVLMNKISNCAPNNVWHTLLRALIICFDDQIWMELRK